MNVLSNLEYIHLEDEECLCVTTHQHWHWTKASFQKNEWLAFLFDSSAVPTEAVDLVALSWIVRVAHIRLLDVILVSSQCMIIPRHLKSLDICICDTLRCSMKNHWNIFKRTNWCYLSLGFGIRSIEHQIKWRLMNIFHTLHDAPLVVCEDRRFDWHIFLVYACEFWLK